MLARLMTRQTLLDKRRHVALRTMDVVASGARHSRARAKALAALQQRHLIPVDVGGRRRVRGRGEIVIEFVTRSVGERRYLRVGECSDRSSPWDETSEIGRAHV